MRSVLAFCAFLVVVLGLLTWGAVLALNTTTRGWFERDVALRYFESWLLRLAGVFPAPDRCPSCARPLAEAGAALAASGESLLCRRCAGENVGSVPVSNAALEFWRRVARESLTKVAAAPPSAATLAEVEEIVGRIRRHFLQGEIRSYRVLRRTLAGLEEAERR